MNIQFEEVKPPKKAPVNQIGETLGLCAGLRPERTDSQFRCAECSRMQPMGSWLVWVPDGVRKSDPAWSVEEAARIGAYNGGSSAWCFSCAPKTKPTLGLAANPARLWKQCAQWLRERIDRAKEQK